MASPAKRQKKDQSDQLDKNHKEDWSDKFNPEAFLYDINFEEVYHHAYHGNSEDTRVAVVTKNLEEELERVKKLKSKWSAIEWKVFPFQGSAEGVVKEVIDGGSTNLIINIEKGGPRNHRSCCSSKAMSSTDLSIQAEKHS